jgi:hypothetical protein
VSPILESIGSVKGFGWGALASSASPVAFDSISTQTLSADAASITFSSIPSTYTHLQIRLMARGTRSTYATMRGTVNGVTTGISYASHDLTGDGTSATAGLSAGNAYMQLGLIPGTNTTNTSIFGVGIIDVLDYNSTAKNKTFKSIAGYDTNNGGGAASTAQQIIMCSGANRATTAITSITLSPNTLNFLAGSTFALYGIK